MPHDPLLERTLPVHVVDTGSMTESFRPLQSRSIYNVARCVMPPWLARRTRFDGKHKATVIQVRAPAFGIMKGVRWRFGQVSVQRVTRDVMTQVDTGTLYVTSKRLLFDGSKKNSSLKFSRIVGFTVFSDGIKIEKDAGNLRDFGWMGAERSKGSATSHLALDC